MFKTGQTIAQRRARHYNQKKYLISIMIILLSLIVLIMLVFVWPQYYLINIFNSKLHIKISLNSNDYYSCSNRYTDFLMNTFKKKNNNNLYNTNQFLYDNYENDQDTTVSSYNFLPFSLFSSTSSRKLTSSSNDEYNNDKLYDNSNNIFLFFYIYNITNAADVLQRGYKPALQEVGPFAFLKNVYKYNIKFNNQYTEEILADEDEDIYVSNRNDILNDNTEQKKKVKINKNLFVTYNEYSFLTPVVVEDSIENYIEGDEYNDEDTDNEKIDEISLLISYKTPSNSENYLCRQLYYMLEKDYLLDTPCPNNSCECQNYKNYKKVIRTNRNTQDKKIISYKSIDSIVIINPLFLKLLYSELPFSLLSYYSSEIFYDIKMLMKDSFTEAVQSHLVGDSLREIFLFRQQMAIGKLLLLSYNDLIKKGYTINQIIYGNVVEVSCGLETFNIDSCPFNTANVFMQMADTESTINRNLYNKLLYLKFYNEIVSENTESSFSTSRRMEEQLNEEELNVEEFMDHLEENSKKKKKEKNNEDSLIFYGTGPFTLGFETEKIDTNIETSSFSTLSTPSLSPITTHSSSPSQIPTFSPTSTISSLKYPRITQFFNPANSFSFLNLTHGLPVYLGLGNYYGYIDFNSNQGYSTFFGEIAENKMKSFVKEVYLASRLQEYKDNMIANNNNSELTEEDVEALNKIFLDSITIEDVLGVEVMLLNIFNFLYINFIQNFILRNNILSIFIFQEFLSSPHPVICSPNLNLCNWQWSYYLKYIKKYDENYELEMSTDPSVYPTSNPTSSPTTSTSSLLFNENLDTSDRPLYEKNSGSTFRGNVINQFGMNSFWFKKENKDLLYSNYYSLEDTFSNSLSDLPSFSTNPSISSLININNELFLNNLILSSTEISTNIINIYKDLNVISNYNVYTYCNQIFPYLKLDTFELSCTNLEYTIYDAILKKPAYLWSNMNNITADNYQSLNFQDTQESIRLESGRSFNFRDFHPSYFDESTSIEGFDIISLYVKNVLDKKNTDYFYLSCHLVNHIFSVFKEQPFHRNLNYYYTIQEEIDLEPAIVGVPSRAPTYSPSSSSTLVSTGSRRLQEATDIISANSNVFEKRKYTNFNYNSVNINNNNYYKQYVFYFLNKFKDPDLNYLFGEDSEEEWEKLGLFQWGSGAITYALMGIRTIKHIVYDGMWRYCMTISSGYTKNFFATNKYIDNKKYFKESLFLDEDLSSFPSISPTSTPSTLDPDYLITDDNIDENSDANNPTKLNYPYTNIYNNNNSYSFYSATEKYKKNYIEYSSWSIIQGYPSTFLYDITMIKKLLNILSSKSYNAFKFRYHLFFIGSTYIGDGVNYRNNFGDIGDLSYIKEANLGNFQCEGEKFSEICNKMNERVSSSAESCTITNEMYENCTYNYYYRNELFIDIDYCQDFSSVNTQCTSSFLFSYPHPYEKSIGNIVMQMTYSLTLLLFLESGYWCDSVDNCSFDSGGLFIKKLPYELLFSGYSDPSVIKYIELKNYLNNFNIVCHDDPYDKCGRKNYDCNTNGIDFIVNDNNLALALNDTYYVDNTISSFSSENFTQFKPFTLNSNDFSVFYPMYSPYYYNIYPHNVIQTQEEKINKKLRYLYNLNYKDTMRDEYFSPHFFINVNNNQFYWPYSINNTLKLFDRNVLKNYITETNLNNTDVSFIEIENNKLNANILQIENPFFTMFPMWDVNGKNSPDRLIVNNDNFDKDSNENIKFNEELLKYFQCNRQYFNSISGHFINCDESVSTGLNSVYYNLKTDDMKEYSGIPSENIFSRNYSTGVDTSTLSVEDESFDIHSSKISSLDYDDDNSIHGLDYEILEDSNIVTKVPSEPYYILKYFGNSTISFQDVDTVGISNSSELNIPFKSFQNLNPNSIEYKIFKENNDKINSNRKTIEHRVEGSIDDQYNFYGYSGFSGYKYNYFFADDKKNYLKKGYLIFFNKLSLLKLKFFQSDFLYEYQKNIVVQIPWVKYYQDKTTTQSRRLQDETDINDIYVGNPDNKTTRLGKRRLQSSNIPTYSPSISNSPTISPSALSKTPTASQDSTYTSMARLRRFSETKETWLEYNPGFSLSHSSSITSTAYDYYDSYKMPYKLPIGFVSLEKFAGFPIFVETPHSWGNYKWGGVEYSFVSGLDQREYPLRSYIDYDPITGKALRTVIRQQFTLRVEGSALFTNTFSSQQRCIAPTKSYAGGTGYGCFAYVPLIWYEESSLINNEDFFQYSTHFYSVPERGSLLINAGIAISISTLFVGFFLYFSEVYKMRKFNSRVYID